MSIATRAVTFLMTLVALIAVVAMLVGPRSRTAMVPNVAMPSDDVIAHMAETNTEQEARVSHGFRGCRLPIEYLRRYR